MTDREIFEAELKGYFVNRLEEGQILVEGESNGINWIIEITSSEAIWVYEETTGDNYISVDAFSLYADALACAEGIR